MINVRIDMKFKPYDDDQGLHLLNKKEIIVNLRVEKDGSIMQECDQIDSHLISC